MKTLLFLTSLFVITVTAASAQSNSEKYAFPQGYEMIVAKVYPGYSRTYVVNESKEKTIKKSVKEPYVTAVIGADGKPMVVDATPEIGDKVLELDGRYWFNASKGQLLIKNVPAPVQYAASGYQQSGQQSAQQSGMSGSQKAMLGMQLLNTAVGVYQDIKYRTSSNTFGSPGYSGGSSTGSSSGVQTVGAGLFN